MSNEQEHQLRQSISELRAELTKQNAEVVRLNLDVVRMRRERNLLRTSYSEMAERCGKLTAERDLLLARDRAYLMDLNGPEALAAEAAYDAWKREAKEQQEGEEQ